MRRFLLVFLVLGLVGASNVRADEPVPTDPARSVHPYRHLEGTYEVDDIRLRTMFDQAVRIVVQLQAEQVREQARIEVGHRRRFQRRTPLGARDTNDLEPSHIPAVELTRLPL